MGGSSAKLVLGERVEERACGLHIRRVSQRPADWRCSLVGRRVGRGAAQDTVRVPAIAMLEPMTPSVEIGVLKAMTEATMMTTRLMVLPTACVTCRRTAARSVAEMELQCGARRQRGHRVDAAEGEEGNLRRQTRHAPRATPLAPAAPGSRSTRRCGQSVFSLSGGTRPLWSRLVSASLGPRCTGSRRRRTAATSLRGSPPEHTSSCEEHRAGATGRLSPRGEAGGRGAVMPAPVAAVQAARMAAGGSMARATGKRAMVARMVSTPYRFA